jgi:puromycin-sensitive aminopeptidase
MPDIPAFRLPRVARPRRYELTLAPDLDAATFTGSVRIQLELSEAAQEIVLNAAELEIHSASVGRGASAAGSVFVSGQPVDAEAEARAADPGLSCTITMDPENEMVRLRPSQPLEAGAHVVEIGFSGALNDRLRGFYLARFKGADGAERVIATTQFEATDARRAFPCFDEPDMKAVFSIRLVVPGDHLAVSNSPILGESVQPDGTKLVRFADTMLMSSYLVAFVVGPLERTEPIKVDGTELAVVYPPGKEHLTAFATETGAFALRFFSGWFGIPYPADKLDLIAIPDFAFGAMENLGAVTFRESLLLVDESAASRSELERIADVICHEIAHMWFGDLVTMKWWNGIWLNEAFATFMELVCMDAYKPTWNRWLGFCLSRGVAQRTDGLWSTRPIEFPVGRPEECEGMFDVLTYEKGASVLRMLEQYLGEVRFQDGIRRYLEKHSYGNAETTDLWDSIEAASRQPVRAIMDTWIFQGGFPLVKVSAGPAPGEITLSQSPFTYLASRPAGSPMEADRGWRVPVAVRAGESDEFSVLLDRDSQVVDTGQLDPDCLVVANASGWGFFRCHYDAELSGRLRSNYDRLKPLERFNLVSDSWACTLAGLESPLAFLDLAEVALASEERELGIFEVVAGAVGLFQRCVPEGSLPALASSVQRLFRPALEAIGWTRREGEDDRIPSLRSVLLGTLGTFGQDPVVIDWGRDQLERYLDDSARVDPDLVGAVVGIVAHHGGRDEYGKYLARYRNPASPQDENRFLYGLGGFREPELISETLGLSLGEIRTQNAPYLLREMLGGRESGPLTFDFISQNFEAILARFPSNTIPRMLDGVSSLFLDPTYRLVKEFFSVHRLRSGQRTLDQALERLEVNRGFLIREAETLTEHFPPG